jgi:hypothetical protein
MATEQGCDPQENGIGDIRADLAEPPPSHFRPRMDRKNFFVTHQLRVPAPGTDEEGRRHTGEDRPSREELIIIDAAAVKPANLANVARPCDFNRLGIDGH